MPCGCKPTLGYPSRGEAIFALCGGGMKLSDAAREIGITQDNARSLLRYQRLKRGLDGYTTSGLEKAARRRRITIDELVARLLTVISREGLVEAILDDRLEAEK